jgi:hypothetical protein
VVGGSIQVDQLLVVKGSKSVASKRGCSSRIWVIQKIKQQVLKQQVLKLGGVSTGGGNDNTVDPGFQQALKEQAKRQSDPVYGDPDPQVDVDPRDRDSITSFKDNYIANVKSNPMYLGIGGLLHTAYQTGKAKSMLSGVPGYEFLDYSDGNNPTVQQLLEVEEKTQLLYLLHHLI